MKEKSTELLHGEVTGRLIEAFYEVYRDLGYGFLERVYENSLAIAARKRGLEVRQQAPIRVHYEGVVVGEYAADLLVNGVVIAELKSVKVLIEEHSAQLLNYLKATPYEVGLLLNFGPRPQHKRRIFQNCRKGGLSWI